MTRRGLFVLLLATLILQPFSVYEVRAQATDWDAGFDPNQILDDADIFDVNGMSYARLVVFLHAKGSLADYRTNDIDGVPKTAAEIIWRVANSYKMNPKYLLALLQKEQSLVEDPEPSQRQYDWATGFGVCDSCSKDDPAIQDYKGFANQLEYAAKQHREKYLMQILSSGVTRSGKAPGKPVEIDGQIVTPINNATAMLYTYTPHIHGNLNLWRIWQRWFALKFPDGTLVRGKTSGETYLIRLGQKRPFESRAVLDSVADPDKVVVISDTELTAYPDGQPIKFPKYALLQDERGRIWLLTEMGRRYITDMTTFRKFGFNLDEVTPATTADLEDYPIAAPIGPKTEFPQGVIMQSSADKTYWYVEGNEKHLVPDKVLVKLYFRGRPIKQATAKKLATYAEGDAYRLHDAELVRTPQDSAVYVVENSLLRPIPSADVFESLGWKWKNVVTVPDALLAAYTKGEAVGIQHLVPQDSETLAQGQVAGSVTTTQPNI